MATIPLLRGESDNWAEPRTSARFMKNPSRVEVRTVRCPVCDASPGHRCVEYRLTGHHGKHIGELREANHAERIEAFMVGVRGGK